MRLSVIIPVYNVAQHLRMCLDSVLSAVDVVEADGKCEIICVDDGSDDGSTAILDEYRLADPRIKVVRQPNQGLGAARNRGLDEASGEWIAFIDSDDRIAEEYFKALFGAVSRTGFDLASIGTEDCEAAEYWCKCNSLPAVAWGKLYRAELWKSLRFPAGRLHEDEYTVHEAVFGAGHIAGVKKRLYHYTVRDGSIMHTSDRRDQSLRDWLEGCSIQAEFLKTANPKAYGIALAKKIQVEHWLGHVRKEDVDEYASVMRGRLGPYYWPEHYRHPVLVNKFTWRIIGPVACMIYR